MRLRRFLRHGPIRKKLTVIAMVPAVLALLAGSMGVVLYDRLTERSALVRNMQVLARTLGSNCRAAIAFNDAEAAAETLAALSAEPQIRSGYIHTVDGRLFAHFALREDADHSFTAERRSSGHQFFRDRLHLYELIELDGDAIGVIHLDVDLAEINSRTQRMALLALLALVVTSCFVFLVVARLQRYVSEPLLGLSETARAVAETDNYTLRAVHQSDDELGFLVSTFNDMLARIEGQSDQLRRSHQDLEQRVRERTAALEQEMLVRQSAQDEIRKSLEEKEVLLKEIHHRVKNNMQVITSLLNLQAQGMQNPDVRAAYQDTIHRVQSMALIHEKLYRSHDVARINFAEYSHSLAQALKSSMAFDARSVRLVMAVDDVLLDVDHAVPCGLIINELVANALKHAFPDHREGTVTIAFRQSVDGALELSVTDDGVGLPADTDISRSRSLGLRLVHSLTRQLGGDLECSSESGTCITIRFRMKVQMSAQEVA